ncbi:hypothetical protein HDU97_005862, partial [Phlyctochytrium planicorne]
SLAILSDAFHLLGDVAGFLIALTAIRFSQRPSTSLFTFGYARMEPLGAIASILLVWCLTFGLVLESLDRLFWHPHEVEPRIMLITAIVGVVVNGVLVVTLHGGLEGLGFGGAKGGCHHHHGGHGNSHKAAKPVKEERAGKGYKDLGEAKDVEEGIVSAVDEDEDHDHHCGNDATHSHSHSHSHSHQHNHQQKHTHKHHTQDTNLHAATLHVIGDLLSSLGVLLSSIILSFHPSLTFVDPLCTLLFAAIVGTTTWPTVRENWIVIMEGMEGDDLVRLEKALTAIQGVQGVHCLHGWKVSRDKQCVVGHIVVEHQDTVKVEEGLMPSQDVSTSLLLAVPSPSAPGSATSPHSAVTLAQFQFGDSQARGGGGGAGRVLAEAHRIAREIGFVHVTFQIESGGVGDAKDVECCLEEGVRCSF